MADTKITALTAISTNPVNPATFPIPMVDLLDTSMAASGTTKKVTVNQILGAGGTATLASATITGAATVGTTLGVTGNSTLTGSVGIGVAPAQKLTVLVADAAQSAQFRAASGYVRLRPYVDATNGGIIDATNTGESAYSNLTILANSLRLFGNSASGLTVGATGDVTVGTGNVVMGTSGKGIDFSATNDGTGTVTSELLNDYEEGTFTPTVRGSTVAGTGVYTTQAGLYTKVGRLVTITVYLNWTAVTLGTGNLQFAGLPFTASSSPVTYNGISIGFVSNIATTAGTVLYGIVEPGSTVITMTQTPTGGGAYGLVPLDTSGEIAFTSTYYV